MESLRLEAERVGPKEQVAERFAHTVGQPALTPVLIAIMQDVAALAERLEVRWRIVARVVIEMGAGQIHPGSMD